MEIVCRHCNAKLEFSGAPPRFCSNCGKALASTSTDNELTATHVFTPPSATAQAPPPRSPVPERIADYRLLRELGRGGMGVVFEAEQEGTGRRVALKLLATQSIHSETTTQRFVQEGRVAAALSHPRSTFVYAAGEDNHQFFIAMELMPGGTLNDVIAEHKRLPTAKAVDYILDVIDGLAAAHEVGVIHRDVKPSNCFIDHEGRVKVGDYGLSKSLVDDAALTKTGSFMGTPQFAAPEQIRGGKIDNRTDVYAVGATLYYLLTGAAPFTGDAARVIADIASEPAPRVEQFVADVPREVNQLVAESLAKDPADRPQSLSEMRRSLEPFATGKSSIADVGRRMAAYFIDSTLASFVSTIPVVAFAMIFSAQLGATGQSEPLMQQRLQIAASLAALLGMGGYFWIAEWRWGRGVGKWLTGLRVIDEQGASPRIWQPLARVALIPGLLIVVPLILNLLVTPEQLLQLSQGSKFERLISVLAPQLFQLSGWAVVLLCMVTMRKSNGFRAVHDTLSRTRVVRSGQHNVRSAVPIPITAAVALRDEQQNSVGPDSIGPYSIEGILYRDAAAERVVYQGQDESLARAVWLVDQPRSAPGLTSDRKALTRPTRLHWLQGGDANGRHWDAFEAVQGSPLAELAKDKSNWPWQRSRGVLLELAEELSRSLADNTLPNQLTLQQVWLDRGGRVKLLDHPASAPIKTEPQAGTQGEDSPSAGGRAALLMQAAVTTCGAPRHLAGFAQDFIDQLQHRPADLTTFAWCVDQLRRQPDRPATLSWDERLGVMAISFGAETTMYSLVGITGAVVVGFLTGLGLWPLLLGIEAFSLTLVAILGFIFDGGPVFRLTGVQVRTGKSAASRLRCAWRNLVAWLFGVTAYALMGSVLATRLIATEEPVDPATAFNDPESLGLFITAGFLILLHAAGAIVAVCATRRGVQDWLSNTYLAPR